MIVGSGLIGQAFSESSLQREPVCIYAAGVSNSHCEDTEEYEKERQLLCRKLDEAKALDAFIYFSTCSIYDPSALSTPYVQHKLLMEDLVREHPRHLIFRLPQLAGKSPNPHTLLNYLHTRVSRGESFQLWANAKRNIIDICDVVAVVGRVIEDTTARALTTNIANVMNYSMLDIVRAMEVVTGKEAIYIPVQRGSEYAIDISAIASIVKSIPIGFDDSYLLNVIQKYFGPAADVPLP